MVLGTGCDSRRESFQTGTLGPIHQDADAMRLGRAQALVPSKLLRYFQFAGGVEKEWRGAQTSEPGHLSVWGDRQQVLRLPGSLWFHPSHSCHDD